MSLSTLKMYNQKTGFIIYLSTGLYLISIGMLFLLIFNLVIGVSLIIFYPYLNANFLAIIQFLGWIFNLIGIFVCLFPLFKSRLLREKKLSLFMIFMIKTIGYFTMILIPIGIFLGISMKQDLQEMKSIIKERKRERKKKKVSLYYLTLIFGGLTHIFIGSVILFLLIPIIIDEIDFLYPYFTFETSIFLRILGWWNLIPGILLLFCSIWSRFLARTGSMDKLMVKIIKSIILVASWLIVILFPFGTFFGIILLQEFRLFKGRSDELK